MKYLLISIIIFLGINISYGQNPALDELKTVMKNSNSSCLNYAVKSVQYEGRHSKSVIDSTVHRIFSDGDSFYLLNDDLEFSSNSALSLQVDHALKKMIINHRRKSANPNLKVIENIETYLKMFNQDFVNVEFTNTDSEVLKEIKITSSEPGHSFIKIGYINSVKLIKYTIFYVDVPKGSFFAPANDSRLESHYTFFDCGDEFEIKKPEYFITENADKKVAKPRYSNYKIFDLTSK